MKYYQCRLIELNGEQEYAHKFLLKSEGIEEDFKTVCMKWFDEDNTIGPDELNLIWCDDGRAVDYSDSDFREISEIEFVQAQHYISDLTGIYN